MIWALCTADTTRAGSLLSHFLLMNGNEKKKNKKQKTGKTIWRIFFTRKWISIESRYRARNKSKKSSARREKFRKRFFVFYFFDLRRSWSDRKTAKQARLFHFRIWIWFFFPVAHIVLISAAVHADRMGAQF